MVSSACHTCFVHVSGFYTHTLMTADQLCGSHTPQIRRFASRHGYVVNKEQEAGSRRCCSSALTNFERPITGKVPLQLFLAQAFSFATSFSLPRITPLHHTHQLPDLSRSGDALACLQVQKQEQQATTDPELSAARTGVPGSDDAAQPSHAMYCSMQTLRLNSCMLMPMVLADPL